MTGSLSGEAGGALPRVITEPIGGGALSRAAASAEPPSFYDRRPASASEWANRVGTVRAGAPAGWLDALRPALGETFAASEAGARLARSASGRGVVVTTGQQPGLFGGPIYTWSKAVGALALAESIESATGVPTAPVFWAATDDADFAEASVTRVAIRADVVTLRLARPGGADGVPMSAVAIGDDVGPALDVLSRAAGSASYARALETARAAYLTPGRTVGAAYLHLLRAVLEPLGVAVLDASHDAVGAAGDALLRTALDRAEQVERAVAERDAAIRAAGYDVQVPSVRGLSLVFRSESARAARQRVSVAESGQVARERGPAVLGPNVLLRPVVERAILPTVAYVAGPGEIAYFAQVGAVADALGAARPLAVPRWSCTIVESHVARALARRGLDPRDLERPHAAEGRLARAAMSPDAMDALATLRSSVRGGVDRLTAAAASGAPGGGLVPRAALDGARRSLEARLDRLERRLVAGAKRVATDAITDVSLARANLYPEGVRQERSLNFLPLLARSGPPLIAAMHSAAAEYAARLVAGAESAPSGDQSAFTAGAR